MFFDIWNYSVDCEDHNLLVEKGRGKDFHWHEDPLSTLNDSLRLTNNQVMQCSGEDLVSLSTNCYIKSFCQKSETHALTLKWFLATEISSSWLAENKKKNVLLYIV